jgi:hypothetical protein
MKLEENGWVYNDYDGDFKADCYAQDGGGSIVSIDDTNIVIEGACCYCNVSIPLKLLIKYLKHEKKL